MNQTFSPETKPRITVFFPAYNDEDSIARLAQKSLGLLPQPARDDEVIGVNDDSRDGTAAVLNTLPGFSPRSAAQRNHILTEED
jgi:glycosyltransferase involved in cell wall biosynthesis